MGARERDEWPRAAWRVTLVREIAPKRLVFVEEMGTYVSLHPLYAWSKRGARARCSVLRNRGPNTTLLASMTLEGMGPCLAVEGATTAAVFEAYIGKVLVPSLRCGQQVVVMDNLSAHKDERIRESSSRARAASSTLSAAVLLTGVQSHRRGLLEAQRSSP